MTNRELHDTRIFLVDATLPQDLVDWKHIAVGTFWACVWGACIWTSLYLLCGGKF